MGNQCTKRSDATSPQPKPRPRSPLTPIPPLPPLEMSRNQLFSTHLSSYETACQFDASLQTFDAVIHERTNRVLGTLATGFEVRSLSLGSLIEVTDCLLEMNQEVVKVILENKKDMGDNKDMFSLVDEYFENIIQSLKFCTFLEECLKRTTNNQLIIRSAIAQFDEEMQSGNGDGNSFGKTLQALAKFKSAGDPFIEEFFAMLQSVLDKQYVLLEKLLSHKRDLDDKLKSLTTWRRISNVIFVSAFVSVLICSVVAAAIAAPPVVTALLGGLTVPVGSVGKWCSSLFNRYRKAVRGQKELVSSMHIGTKIVLKDWENIRVLTNKFEIEIQSIMHNAQFAPTEEGSLKIVIETIAKQLEVITETTEILSRQNLKCIQDIKGARRAIVQKIVKSEDDESLSNMCFEC